MSNRIKSVLIITFLALLPLICIAQTSWSNLGEKAASYAIDLEGTTYGLGCKGIRKWCIFRFVIDYKNRLLWLSCLGV